MRGENEGEEENLRVSGTIVIFFSPSPRRKSSNLEAMKLAADRINCAVWPCSEHCSTHHTILASKISDLHSSVNKSRVCIHCEPMWQYCRGIAASPNK